MPIQTSLLFNFSNFQLHNFFSDGCAYTSGTDIICNRWQHAAKSGIPQQYTMYALIMR